ncbi:flagellar hook-length control protein FliK [Paraglaciecola sp. L3A3]|uniref:flagellar hook-length control protein FliK n=1 Tax=Paraglaciecola sp. L3A3 TaxID=2686358 RepID=UPI00131C255F|nr:flagellar hook-length control protein FliK [Paraglaciecola sp. L3A3]
MMQQVATTKSEVAAIAAGTKAELQFGSDSNQDFERLLQEQQNPSDRIKSSEKVNVELSAKTTNDISIKAQKSSIQETVVSTDEKSLTAAAEKELTISDKSSDKKLEVVTQDKLEVVEPKPVQSATSNEKSRLNEDVLLTDSIGTIKAQEWISLVENLQKLDQQSQSIGQNNDATKVTEGIDGHLSAAGIAEFMDAESKIFEGIGDESAEELILETEHQTRITVGEDVIAKQQADDDNEEKLQIANDLSSTEQILTEWLEKNIANLPSGKTSKSDVSQELTADAVVQEWLNQPIKLQQIFAKLVEEKKGAESNSEFPLQSEGQVIEQKSAEDLTENVDNLPDLTKLENKELLSALLAETEVITDVESETTDDVQGQLSLGETSVSQMGDILHSSRSQISNELSTENNIEQSSELVLEPASIELQTESEVTFAEVVKNPTMLTLATMPEAKLDKVLTNIAERLLEKVNPAETVSRGAEASVTSDTIELANITSSPLKDFVATLKVGIAEFKTQLSQGREPGIDLKSLVSESIDKLMTVAPNSKVVDGSEQIMNGFSQVLDFAANLNRALEHQQTNQQGQTYNALHRDVAQIQGEQTKQSQLSQFESRFEKAVNIAKPEGLQQLAEKVRWMVNTKNLVAEIRLDPADLGSVHVKVAMSGDTASVNFVVQSQHARDAMDGAAVKLREMLAEKGIELGQSSVRQESDAQQQQSGEQLAGGQNSSLMNTEDENSIEQGVIQQKVVNGALGGIDYFV